MYKKAFLILISMLVLSGFVLSQSGQVVILNMEKVKDETKIGKELSAKLDKTRKDKENDLKAKANQIREIQTKLQSSGNILSESKRLELKQQEEKLRLEYKELLERSQQEIMSYQQKLSEEYNKVLMPVLEKLCKEKNYKVVLRSDIAIYADKAYDITDDFIKRVNASVK